MFIEITREAFNKLVHPGTPVHEVLELELARKEYFLVYGVKCSTVLCHITGIKQYYIQDINA